MALFLATVLGLGFGGSLAWAQSEQEVDLRPIVVRGQSIEGTVEDGYAVETLRYSGPWGSSTQLETPYSINVMSSDLIKNLAIKTEDDIMRLSPNIQMQAPTDLGGAVFAIRGFNQGRGSSGARYQDGMHVANSNAIMEDKDRVEVLSGLSGFLYGPGAAGGIMNYVLKRPPSERISRISVGGYGGSNLYAHVDLGGPIGEKFGYRVNFGGQDGETAVDDNNLRRTFFSGAFDWYINDDMTLQINGAYAKKRVVNIPVTFMLAPGAQRPKPFDASKNWNPGDNSFLEHTSSEFGVNYSWKVNNNFSVRSAYRYGRYDMDGAFVYYRTINSAGNTVSVRTTNYNPIAYIQNQGYMYTDTSFNTGPMAHKLTIGGSLDHVKIETKNVNSGGDNIVRKTGEEYNQSLIIGDEIKIGDKWTVLAGVNFATIINEAYNINSGLRTSKMTNRKTTPTFSILFKPIPTITLYGTYIESLTAGGIVTNSTQVTYINEGEALPAFMSEQYEFGVKAQIRNILLTFAAFEIEKANAYDEPVPNSTLQRRTQDGRQTHRGLDISATGKIFDDFTIFAGATFLDAKIKKVSNPAVLNKRPINVPKTVFKLYAEYALPFLKGASITGGMFYNGSMYGDNINTDKVPSSVVFDLGARYKTELAGSEVTFRLNVANVADKKYWASGYYFGPPRTITFYMDWAF
ncbi:MAG: TonB-dependent receptor [Deltaproteobacteria bacterium]|nr:TonB-dependent receptor [Deltaproteobacteria bacterium]